MGQEVRRVSQEVLGGNLRVRKGNQLVLLGSQVALRVGRAALIVVLEVHIPLLQPQKKGNQLQESRIRLLGLRRN